jgi:hypothetical protein
MSERLQLISLTKLVDELLVGLSYYRALPKQHFGTEKCSMSSMSSQ